MRKRNARFLSWRPIYIFLENAWAFMQKVASGDFFLQKVLFRGPIYIGWYTSTCEMKIQTDDRVRRIGQILLNVCVNLDPKLRS